MDASTSAWLAQQREAFERKRGVRRYYEDLYRIIDLELGDATDVLELGCGIGMSRALMPQRRFLATDAVETPYAESVMDAQHLALDDASQDAIFAVDVLHHVPRPVRMVQEALRVLRPGGRLVLVEPYASPIGTWVYRLFHPEPMDLGVDVWGEGPITSDHVMDANQAVATLMFERDARHMPAPLREACTFVIRRHSLLSFLATGGINRRLGMPAWMITLLLRIERRAPGWLNRLAALRIIVVVTKSC